MLVAIGDKEFRNETDKICWCFNNNNNRTLSFLYFNSFLLFGSNTFETDTENIQNTLRRLLSNGLLKKYLAIELLNKFVSDPSLSFPSPSSDLLLLFWFHHDFSHLDHGITQHQLYIHSNWQSISFEFKPDVVKNTQAYPNQV